ncbi:hypothetical protein BMS3Abin03_00713 [bacterium BMS3Abin03]|nr:hypothetical protein BMS3Abin03_00713 [bacterium BMS3Abin03]
MGAKTNIGRVKSRTKLLMQIHQNMHTKSYNPETIQSYVKWIKDYIIYNGTNHPKELKKENVEKLLAHLAVDNNVSASTQNQASSVILYLNKNIIKTETGLNTHSQSLSKGSFAQQNFICK